MYCAGAVPDADQDDDCYQGFPGHYYTDKFNSKIWIPAGVAHGATGIPFDETTPWEDPYAMELARGKQPKDGRMLVDATPAWLEKGDMYLYGGSNYAHDAANGRPQLSKRGSLWLHPGQGRDDVAIASTLVLKGSDLEVDPSRLAPGAVHISTLPQGNLAQRAVRLF